MAYSESLGIILMRDNGPRRSFRVSRRLFYSLLVFFSCLPLVCAGLAWHGFRLFQKNEALGVLLEQREAELKLANASARRLENLEVLLQENTLEGREQILRRLAMAEDAKARSSQSAPDQKTVLDARQTAGKTGNRASNQHAALVAANQETGPKQPAMPEKKQDQTGKAAEAGNDRSVPDRPAARIEVADKGQSAGGQAGTQSQPVQENGQQGKPEAESGNKAQSPGKANDEGPGHEEFQEIDEHFVRVGNVQARAFTGNRLRIALDLHNTDKQEQAVGSVRATLLTAAGNRHQIIYEQKDAGDFRINRFKRAVMLSKIPHEFRMANAQIQIEVFMHDGTLVYRNIYSVEH